MQKFTSMTRLRLSFDRADAYWNQTANDQRTKAYKVALLILITILAVSTGLVVWTGPVPQNIYGHDTPLFYDGAWRITQGQIPHVDFHSALGSLFYILIAWGMKASSVSANSISYAIAITLIPALALSWISVYRKTSVLYAFLFCLFILFTLIGTHYLGSSYWETTYSGYYNRFASAFFFILLIETFLTDRPDLHQEMQKRSNDISGLIIGICAAILFWTKISFFAVAIGALALSVIIRSNHRPLRWLVGVAVGGLLVTIPMSLYLRIGVVNYIQDLQLAAAARLASPLYMVRRILLAFIMNYIHIAWIGYIVWVWKTNPAISRLRLAIILSFFILASLAIFATNSTVPGPEKELPTLALPTFIALEYLRRKNRLSDFDPQPLARFGWWFVAQIGLIFVLTFIIKDLASFVYASTWHFTDLPHIPDSYRFNSKTLYDLVNTSSNFPFKNINVTNTTYTELVNDGLFLLAASIEPSDRVTVLDFTNPFSFGLMQYSPRGDAVWWDVDFTLSNGAYIPANKIFQTTTKVMVNRYSTESDAIMQVYGTYVHQNYRLEAQSKYWDLYTIRYHQEQ